MDQDDSVLGDLHRDVDGWQLTVDRRKNQNARIV
jgi:hypothetical protein